MDEEKFFQIIKSTAQTVDTIFANIDDYYIEKKEPKKDGRTGEDRRDRNGNILYRTLYLSREPLKKIQELIHLRILGVISYPEYVQGGVRRKSYATNARTHLGKKYKMQTDIKNFFPSISHKMVFEALVHQGFHIPVARLITKLATYKGHVPQGTTTATSIANLVFYHLADKKIDDFCKRNAISYTRYVDDIICSSQTDFKALISEILKMITDSGFRISHNKTGYGTSPMIITGVLTKNNVLDVPEDWEKKVNDPNRSEKSREGLMNHREYIKRVSKRKSR
jgi:RNA-directed DNA polymerase